MHNLADQPIGHSKWEIPLGNVTTGMDVLRSIYAGYGEHVDQGRLLSEGTAYTRREYPRLDYILSCVVLLPPPPPLHSFSSFGERVMFLPYVLGLRERLWTPDVLTLELVDMALLVLVVGVLLAVWRTPTLKSRSSKATL